MGLTALGLAVLTAPALADVSLLDTASYVPGIEGGDTLGGLFQGSQVWLGAPFTTTQTYTVTSLGFAGAVQSGTLFLALVPADPTTDVVTTPNLSNSVYETTFSGPNIPSDIAFSTNFSLAPGTYDLIAGSGEFGASGTGVALGAQDQIGPPSYVTGGIAPSGSYYAFEEGPEGEETRFFVNGVMPTTAAVPESSSFALLGLALPALGVLVRRRVRK